MNIFEKATKLKLRFPTLAGEVTTEQVWDLPLTARRSGQPDLDTTAQTLDSELKKIPEKSFVRKNDNSVARERLELALEIVKHVIAHKQADSDNAEKRLAREQQKIRLKAILASKEEKELEGLSKEDILKQLEELGSE